METLKKQGAHGWTIAHELPHLVKGNSSEISRCEVACDIWRVDRLPADLLDQQPYYLMNNSRCDWKKNRDAIKELCRQTIEIRKSRRTYIVWLRSQIRQLDAGSRTRRRVCGDYMLSVNYHGLTVLSMEGICEICKASEPLLELNKVLACAACFKRRIQSVAREVTKHR